MAAASTGAASHRALDPLGEPSPDFSAEASSSSSTSRAVESRPVSCEEADEGEGDALDLDSPWVGAAEVELVPEEAAAAASAAALRISGEDELEEDEIRDNQQRQEDELMALEAIYGGDLVVFENKRGLRYFQIYIRYDVAEGTEVCATLSSADVCRKDEGCSDGIEHGDGLDVFNCNFEYLPPLILTCLLPRSFSNCEMLDTIWAELPGQEIVYQWVEWLRNSSRSHIWFDGKLTLGPDIVTHTGDNRAISRTNSLESVIPLMLTYSRKKHYQAFLEDIHMCMICLNQSKGSNFVRLSCQHLFCVKCMQTLCRMHVKEGSVFQLICSGTKCNASIPPYLLKRLLSEEEFERWDRLVLQKALDSMSDVVYCPRCAIGCLEDESNNAQCPECSFIFCSLCKEPCYPGKKCLTPEEKIQRQQASGRMSEKEMAKELLSIRKLCNDIQLCPKCRMAIVKTEGCNKMACGNCGQLLCFRCGRAISGYDHFRDCELFAMSDYIDSDVEPWERHMDEVQIARWRRVELSPIGSTVRCPKCRQRNFKEDEKYIFCWACRIHYCALCRMRVEDRYMRSGHYGSSECVGLGNF
ncbi:hypothetical protein ACP4OV_031289 [Aristida adscensionis]